MKELHPTRTTERKAVIEAAICQLLQWTAEEYANNILNNGITYLATYCGSDKYSARTLKGSAIYWKWWRNLWLIRDEVFINSGLQFISLSSRREIYAALHQPKILACEIYPPSIIWKEADREELVNLLTPATC